MISKLELAQSNAHQNIQWHNGSNNQQRIKNNRTTALKRAAAKGIWGLKCIYWYQIFALDSAVVEAQKCKLA